MQTLAHPLARYAHDPRDRRNIATHQLGVPMIVFAVGWGVGLFVADRIIQFVAQGFERREPAFTDDLRGLLVGPLFVAAPA